MGLLFHFLIMILFILIPFAFEVFTVLVNVAEEHSSGVRL